MTTTAFDPEAARRDLIATARGQGAIADRNIARVHAEAAVSQAESLARIADLVEALVAPTGDPIAPAPRPTGQTLEVGDVVYYDGDKHVDETGWTEGEQWVMLIDDEGLHYGRLWSHGLTVVRHDSTATDDVDADFATSAEHDEAGEGAKADAFTAARKATGKAKKGGKS